MQLIHTHAHTGSQLTRLKIACDGAMVSRAFVSLEHRRDVLRGNSGFYFYASSFIFVFENIIRIFKEMIQKAELF